MRRGLAVTVAITVSEVYQTPVRGTSASPPSPAVGTTAGPGGAAAITRTIRTDQVREATVVFRPVGERGPVLAGTIRRGPRRLRPEKLMLSLPCLKPMRMRVHPDPGPTGRQVV